MTYEYYSSLALVSSVVVYALAMFAHAAEWAAARRLGVPSLLLANWSTSRLPRCAALSLPRRALSLPRCDLSPSTGLSLADPENDPAASRRVEQFGRIAVALTIIGFLLSVAGVVTRALAAQRAPWGNMFEFTITAMVLFVGVYLILVWRAGLRWLGLPVTLLAAVGTVWR